MGIQTMGSQSNGQQSHLQANQLVKQNSWYGLTLDEVNSLLGDLGKPLGSMNLDELLQNVWTAEGNKVVGMESEQVSSSSSLQRQASMTLARALSGKTVDDVWREIQLGQKKQYGDDVKVEDREMGLGGTTLEDFLVQAGLFAGASISPTVGLDAMDTAIPQSFQPKTSLVSSSSISSLSDAKSGRKRDAPDAYEKALERRLRRKIKNRESAARSRARKQAYHNELVTKVTLLEQQNMQLKKEKEFEQGLQPESSPEPKYRLRRVKKMASPHIFLWEIDENLFKVPGSSQFKSIDLEPHSTEFRCAELPWRATLYNRRKMQKLNMAVSLELILKRIPWPINTEVSISLVDQVNNGLNTVTCACKRAFEPNSPKLDVPPLISVNDFFKTELGYFLNGSCLIQFSISCPNKSEFFFLEALGAGAPKTAETAVCDKTAVDSSLGTSGGSSIKTKSKRLALQSAAGPVFGAKYDASAGGSKVVASVGGSSIETESKVTTSVSGRSVETETKAGASDGGSPIETENKAAVPKKSVDPSMGCVIKDTPDLSVEPGCVTKGAKDKTDLLGLFSQAYSINLNQFVEMKFRKAHRAIYFKDVLYDLLSALMKKTWIGLDIKSVKEIKEAWEDLKGFHEVPEVINLMQPQMDRVFSVGKVVECRAEISCCEKTLSDLKNQLLVLENEAASYVEEPESAIGIGSI